MPKSWCGINGWIQDIVASAMGSAGSMDNFKSHHWRVAELLLVFIRSLEGADRLSRIAGDLIGYDAEIVGPLGAKALVYADYVASGRALRSVEGFILDKVLPFYAN